MSGAATLLLGVGLHGPHGPEAGAAAAPTCCSTGRPWKSAARARLPQVPSRPPVPVHRVREEPKHKLP